MPQNFFYYWGLESSPCEVHTKTPFCDVVVRCIRPPYGCSDVLATWTQEPVSTPYEIQKVNIWAPYWFMPMTFLQTPIRSVMKAVRSPQAAYIYEAPESPYETIGSNRPADLVRHTYETRTDGCLGSFTGPKSQEACVWTLRKVDFRPRAIRRPYGYRILQKIMCGSEQLPTKRVLMGIVRDCHVTEPF